jgi:outer membrane protein OmpA-like peptidoglycan-associated protein
MKKLFLFAGVIGAASLSPLVAYADGPIPTPLDAPPTSIMYLAPNAQYQWQNMPKFQTGTLTGGTTPFYTHSATVSGPAGGITAGLFLPGNWPQLGTGARAEFSAQFFDMTENTSNVYSGATDPGFTFVSGAAPVGTGGVFSNSLKTEYQGYDLAVRAATDFQLFSNLAVTPAIGIFGGNSNATFDYDDTEECTAGTCFREFSREAVSTNRIGGTVSLGTRFPVMTNVALVGGVSASLYGADSRLNANDCFADAAPGTACGGGASIETFHSATKSTMGGRLGAQAGVRYNAGWAALDLTGGINWDSAVPGVSNGAIAGQAATIRYSGELGYQVGLKVTFPFGGGATVTPVAAAAPPVAPPPPVAAVPSKQMFIVFFEFDKSALTADGKKVVDAAAAAFKSGKPGVAIAGYTDLAGTQQYNLALSKRRADVVKSALVRDGVSAAAIDESWHGKENPRVPTADGVREPQNRRVEITM